MQNYKYEKLNKNTMNDVFKLEVNKNILKLCFQTECKAFKISNTFLLWNSGQPFITISHVYLIMAGVVVSRQSEKVKVFAASRLDKI